MMDSTNTSSIYARIPNILTVGRIICVPFLIAGIILIGSTQYEAAWIAPVTILLFGLACISDYLDGYWARKWNVTSDFGRMIDPIADKLLVAGCLIAVSIVHSGHWSILIPALAIIGRDITVSGVREFAALNGRAMPPTKLAKWKTAFEMLAIILLILAIVILADLMKKSNVSINTPEDLALHTPTTLDPLYNYLNTTGAALLWHRIMMS